MLLVFDSKTGNVRRFVNKLGIEAIQISEDTIVSTPFVLVTYTTDFGSVPVTTAKFLENNHLNLVGVASSGNRNWGNNFGLAADKIASKYKVPMLFKFELHGTPMDIKEFRNIIDNFCLDQT